MVVMSGAAEAISVGPPMKIIDVQFFVIVLGLKKSVNHLVFNIFVLHTAYS